MDMAREVMWGRYRCVLSMDREVRSGTLSAPEGPMARVGSRDRAAGAVV